MNHDDFFAVAAARFSGKAPALLDVMGGTADHAGSLTLTLPLQAHFAVTAARRTDGLLRLRLPDAGGHPASPPDIFLPAPGPNNPWAACAAACLKALAGEAEPPGADVCIAAAPPLPEGLSATTAAVTALLRALAPACGLAPNTLQAAALAQRVCHALSGTPRSLRAPLACLSGVPGQLLPVLCQPGHLAGPITLPPGMGFAAIGLEGAAARSRSDARTAAAMGYVLLALQDGTHLHELAQARDSGQRDHLLYGGYLANIEPREFEDRYGSLPTWLAGREFLEKAGVVVDAAEIDPGTLYPVLAATRHAVYENTRTQYFSLLLQHLPPPADADRREKSLRQLGQWMYQSHEGNAACGATTPRADAFVASARNAAPAGVYGARATGGGAVCLLWAGDDGLQTAHRLCAEHMRRFGGEAFLMA